MEYVKKIGRFLFGEKCSRWQVSVALYLGTLVGLTPSFVTLQSILGIMAIGFFRISWRLFGFSLCCWYFFGLAFGDKILHLLGKSLLDSSSLESFWKMIDLLPIIPWMKLTTSGILGSFVLSSISLPFYYWLIGQLKKENKEESATSKENLFRKKVWIPSVVFVSIAGFYKMYYLDMHLKSGLIKGLEMVNGAQVDIASLKTTYFPLRLTIKGLALTDKNDPQWNKIVIGNIDFKLDKSALWRGKFIIDFGKVEGIDSKVKRASPGWVKKEEVEVKKEISMKDVFRPVVEMLENFDPVKDIKNFKKEDLKTVQVIEGLKLDIAQQKEKWNNLSNVIPTDWSQEQQVIKNIKLSVDNPIEIPKKIQEIKDLITASQEKIKKAKDGIEGIKKDIGGYEDKFKSIEDSIKEDRKFVESKLKIPDLDLKEIALGLFGNEIKSRIHLAMGYYQKFSPYLNKGKSEKDSSKEVKKVRSIGERYQFSNEEKWPFFWTREISINSPRKTGEDNHFVGKIYNITSDQKVLGLKTSVHLESNLPKYKIFSIKFHFENDALQDPSKNMLTFNVNKLLEEKIALSSSDMLKVDLLEGETLVITSFMISEMKIDGNLELNLIESKFQVESPKDLVKKIMEEVLSTAKAIKIKANVKGFITNPEISLESNISEKIKEGFNKALSSQMQLAKEAVDKFINESIEKEKSKLLGQFQDVKGQLLKSLNLKDKNAMDIQNWSQDYLKNALEEIKKGTGKEIVKDKLKDLKDKIKFKGF